MKILEVLDCFYPNYDGPVEVAVNLARKFGEMGPGEMHLLVPDYPERASAGALSKVYSGWEDIAGEYLQVYKNL